LVAELFLDLVVGFFDRLFLRDFEESAAGFTGELLEDRLAVRALAALASAGITASAAGIASASTGKTAAVASPASAASAG